jgi:Ca2+-binding RTX toxin-like protein
VPVASGPDDVAAIVTRPTPTTIVGTNEADLLVGTPGDDVIVGLGGRDVIAGKDGNDLLCGGRGSDLVSGNGGDDFVRLSGGSGNDTLGSPVDVDVEVGNDRLLGVPGDDGLDGGPGFDRLNGQAGVDSCVNGEVLVSCEASAAAAGQRLATTARATRGYGRQ